MKIYHNVQIRSLKWIITLFLIVGIVWMSIELVQLTIEMIDKMIFGCLENEDCFFSFVEEMILRSEQTNTN